MNSLLLIELVNISLYVSLWLSVVEKRLLTIEGLLQVFHIREHKLTH